MTWLDERLFGWRQSGWDGAGGSTSELAGDTDDGDAGDYDHVISLIPGNDSEVEGKLLTARTTSYADIQQLRLSSVTDDAR